MRDVPVRSGRVDLLGGWAPLVGPFARAEVGIHPWADVGLHAFGQVDREGPMVGVGIRYEFDW